MKDAIFTEALNDNPVVGMSILYETLSKLPLPMALACVCTALDNVFADNGLTEAEAISMYKRMYESAKNCYKELGMPR